MSKTETAPETVTVKPAVAGTKIHLENQPRDFLPADGADVPRSTYWLRRISDGSVVEVAASPRKSGTPSPAAADPD